MCGLFSAFLLVPVLLKIILFPEKVKEDMGNPIMASVSGTFPMALMILSTYVKPFIGQAAFYIWILAIVLLVLVTYRYLNFKEIPEPARALVCIYAASTSLCIAGYVQSVTPKSKEFLMGMFAVATVLYIFALAKAVSFLKLPFYPSMAAFTFPFVISAIASKQTMACLANMGSPMPALQTVVLIETVIAVALVAYTYARFMMAIFGGKK